jgi:hypothetical protein
MTLTIEVPQHACAVILRIVPQGEAAPGEDAGAAEYDSWAAVFNELTCLGRPPIRDRPRSARGGEWRG